MRFLPTQREAWLVDLEGSGARTQGDLCERHAGALTLPRGWNLHDDRDGGSVTLVVVAAVAEDEIHDDVTVAAEVAVEVEAEPEVGAERESVVDRLANVLDARTPLLRRAFANVSPLDAV